MTQEYDFGLKKAEELNIGPKLLDKDLWEHIHASGVGDYVPAHLIPGFDYAKHRWCITNSTVYLEPPSKEYPTGRWRWVDWVPLTTVAERFPNFQP